MVAVLDDRIYVYQLVDLAMKDAIETCENPDGICALNLKVLACPEKNWGEIRINNYATAAVTNIKAHDNNISAIALNEDSSWVATASDKGTLIWIWSTKDSSKLKEVRWGADNARIYCLAFNKSSTLISVASDKGTCHLYNLNADEKKAENKTSWFSGLGKVVSYFGSEWSVSSYKFIGDT